MNDEWAFIRKGIIGVHSAGAGVLIYDAMVFDHGTYDEGVVS